MQKQYKRLSTATTAARAIERARRGTPDREKPVVIVCTMPSSPTSGPTWELATDGAALAELLARRVPGSRCQTAENAIDTTFARYCARCDLARSVGLTEETPWQVVHDALIDAGQDTSAAHLATLHGPEHLGGILGTL